MSACGDEERLFGADASDNRDTIIGRKLILVFQASWSCDSVGACF